MLVLVVEDERAVRDPVSRELRSEGYDVHVASSGGHAVDLMAEHVPDVVVIDMGTPGPDGLETCRLIRAKGAQSPILMVSACSAVSDRVAGLDAGADDYLVKPYAQEELLARVRALLRRNEPPSPAIQSTRRRDGRITPNPVDGRRMTLRVAGVAPAIAISIAYLLVRPASKDFASGDFRARLFREGAFVWNLHWFGGHPLPGYGVISPLLSALFGTVPVALGSMLIASWAFGEVVSRQGNARPSLPSPTVATMLFSVGCGLSVWGGRLTFGPAVAFGSLSVLCMQRTRKRWAVVAGALCGLSSPVGAVSLVVVVAACWVARTFDRRGLLWVAVATITPPVIIGMLFPEGGWYPFPGASLAMLGIALGGIGWFGRHNRTVAVTVIVYAAVAVAAFMIRSPLGANIVRLAWLAAAPAAALTFTRFRKTLLPLFVAFTIIWGWSYVKLGLQPAAASARASYYDPLAAFVLRQPGGVHRVEIVPTETFRQADELALQIDIARGWEAQLDRQLNPEFYDHLSADTYHRWLLRNAVEFVALPSSDVQRSSRNEQAIIAGQPSYLSLVFSTAEWHVYRVLDAAPLASNDSTVTSVGATALTIRATRPGITTLRFRFSKWFHITAGSGCVGHSPDGWLQVHIKDTGAVTVDASFTLAAAFGDTEQCS